MYIYPIIFALQCTYTGYINKSAIPIHTAPTHLGHHRTWSYTQNMHNTTENVIQYVLICYLFYQFSSVAQSCPTLCDPMTHSTPGLPVHHQLPEFTQTHVHQVVDAIQPSHPLLSPSPPAPNPSQHQSFPMSQLFA